MFTEVSLDKWQWSPSPLPGQVVLVTSCDGAGVVDVAPKSWVTMVGMTGPRIGFGCTWEHRTARNIAATSEFVVNIPDDSLASVVWHLPDIMDRLAVPEMATAPGITVKVPVLTRCYANFECRLDQIVELEAREVFIIGIVQRIGLSDQCLAPSDVSERYGVRRSFFFLEDGWLAPLGPARSVTGS